MHVAQHNNNSNNKSRIIIGRTSDPTGVPELRLGIARGEKLLWAMSGFFFSGLSRFLNFISPTLFTFQSSLFMSHHIIHSFHDILDSIMSWENNSCTIIPVGGGGGAKPGAPVAPPLYSEPLANIV